MHKDSCILGYIKIYDEDFLDIKRVDEVRESAYTKYKQVQESKGEFSEQAQLYLTIYRQCSIQTSKEFEAIQTIQSRINENTNNTYALVSYLHDLADIYMGIAGRNINDESIFNLYLDTVERYRSILLDDPEIRSSAESVGILSSHEIKIEELLCRYINKCKGKNNPDTIDVMFAHGQLLESLEKTSSAIPFYKKALSGSEFFFGEEHTKTVDCIEHLGHCYYQLFDYNSACTFFEKAYYINCKYGYQSFYQAFNLVNVYHETNKENDALELYQTWSEKIPLKNSLDREEILFHVRYAGLLSELNRFEEAMCILKKALKRIRFLYGKSDVDAIYVETQIADLYGAMGLHKKSIRILNRICNLPKNSAYVNTDDYMFTCAKLGYAYVLDGAYAKGRSILDHFTPLIEDCKTADRKDILVVLNMLSIAYGALEDLQEEFRIQKIIYEERMRILGENHYDTLLSENNLAVTCRNIAQSVESPEEEKEWYKLARYFSWDVYKRSAKNRGHSDYFTMLTLRNKADLLEIAGDTKNAERMLERVLHVFSSVGEYSPDTMESQYRLGVLYAENSRFEQGEEVLSDCLVKLSKIKGDSHPDTLRCLKELAKVTYDLGIVSYFNAKKEKQRLEAYNICFKALDLFINYFDNIKQSVYDSFFIESIRQRSSFFSEINDVLTYVFLLCSNSEEIGLQLVDYERLYERIALLKHISFDVQFQRAKSEPKLRQKISQYQSLLEKKAQNKFVPDKLVKDLKDGILSEINPNSFIRNIEKPVLSTIRKNLKGAALIDIWIDADVYCLFFITTTAVQFKVICDKEDLHSDTQFDRLDELLSTVLKRELMEIDLVYYCPHSSCSMLPIGAVIENKFDVKVVHIPSIQTLFHKQSFHQNSSIYIAAAEDDEASTQEANLIAATQIRDRRVKYIPLTKKRLLSTPFEGILHISTHGFYTQKANSIGFSDSYIQLGETDIISANELTSLDLSKTSLVVLSACRTNMGHFFKNFGVYSVACSLQLAGAKQIIATLGDIPVIAALAFSKEFYSCMERGMVASDALHCTKKRMYSYTEEDCRALLTDLANQGATSDFLRIVHASFYGKTQPLKEPINWAMFVLFQV